MKRLLFCIATLWFVFPLHAFTTQSQTQIAFDSREDIEPAMISQVRSNGLEYTITVNMKFNPTAADGSLSTLQSTTIMSNGGQNVTTIPSVTGYEQYGDPVLARDDRTTTAKPVYLAGLILHQAGGADRSRSGIALWHSSDGGFTWTSHGAIVAQVGADPYSPNTPYKVIDKPAIAVGPNGTIYLAYVQLSSEGGIDNQIMLTSSSDGGWTWSYPLEVAPAMVPYPQNHDVLIPSQNHAPQVVVDSNNDVYVLWIRPTDNIDAGIYGKVARATQPLAFSENLPVISAPASALYGSQKTPGQVPIRFTTNGNNQPMTEYVRAVTVPMAKLDSATGRRRLVVTWHELNDSGSSNIRLAVLGLASAYPAGTVWNTKTFTRAGGFNLQPALDFNPATGTFLVTYYAFGGNNTFWQFGNTVTFSGNTPLVDENQAITNVVSDILVYAPQYNTGDLATATESLRYLGEYHDVSYSGSTFKTVGIVCVTTGNPWLWTIN